MDIPALSMNMAKIDLTNSVGVAMLSKSLDVAKTQGSTMVEMMDRSMELSVTPYLGGNVDLLL